jgi:hypothetical protein
VQSLNGIAGLILMPTREDEPAAAIMASRASTTKRIRFCTLPPYASARVLVPLERNCIGM